MIIKTAIVEDETDCARELSEYLEHFAECYGMGLSFNVTLFENGDVFCKKYTPDYDLIFMDIKMPGINGMKAAKYLRKIDARVTLVFVTNMRQYALQGYAVGTRDYILKPLEYSEFEYHMKKIIPYLAKKEDKKIILSFMDEKVRISVSDIYYIEVDGHNLIYHTVTGDYKTKSSLVAAEKQLQSTVFVRCNSGYLVNLEYVRSIKGNWVKVANDILPISRPKKQEFIDRFTVYIGGSI